MVQTPQHDVLIVSHDSALMRVILEAMAAAGIHAVVARDEAAARQRLEDRPWDLVLADLEGLGSQACRFLRDVKAASPELPVVMTSEAASVRQAVRVMRAGCEDLLIKPLDRAEIDRLLEELLPSHEVPAAAESTGTAARYQIVGRGEGIMTLLAAATKVAPTSIPVLITGESGTGKELISHYVHARSSRSGGPYVRVNCAAMSETLLESELFGHERGAFTGAVSQRKGLFERAHGGTLLLDEISETGDRLQAKLLRVLEQQDFERVGGTESIRVNVRVLSTSNRDLSEEVRAGRFRQDLYYRLSGVRLRVPPLRERTEDLPPLVWHFVNQYARETRRQVREICPEMMAKLCEYPWPGNVRELRNVVRTALVMGEGPRLGLDGVTELDDEVAGVYSAHGASLQLRQVEREAILEALRRTNSHHAKAARLLGITDRTLREKLRRYRDDRQEQPQASEPAKWLTETA